MPQNPEMSNGIVIIVSCMLSGILLGLIAIALAEVAKMAWDNDRADKDNKKER